MHVSRIDCVLVRLSVAVSGRRPGLAPRLTDCRPTGPVQLSRSRGSVAAAGVAALTWVLWSGGLATRLVWVRPLEFRTAMRLEHLRGDLERHQADLEHLSADLEHCRGASGLWKGGVVIVGHITLPSVCWLPACDATGGQCVTRGRQQSAAPRPVGTCYTPSLSMCASCGGPGCLLPYIGHSSGTCATCRLYNTYYLLYFE